MSGGSPNSTAVILAITAKATGADALQVRVGVAGISDLVETRNSRRGRIVASLSAKGVEELGLTPGLEYSDALKGAVERRVVYERARRQAAGWLAKGGLPRSKVSARLERFELGEGDRAALLNELESLGLIDDAGLAGRAALARMERAPVAREMLAATLERRGLSSDDAGAAAREATRGREPLADAKGLALKRVRTFAATLGPSTVRRRLFAYLARRGYDEETAEAAVEHAMRRRG